MLKIITNPLKDGIKRNPMKSFFAILILLFAVIFIGSSMRKPIEIKKEDFVQVKEAEVFNFGRTPYLSLSAKVDKNNAITINATTNGIVENINSYAGQKVSPGTVLVSLSDTYNGANISDVDRRIAQETKDTQDITYSKGEDVLDYQKDLISKDDSKTNKIARKQITIQKRNLDLAKEITDLNLEKAEIADALHYPCAPTYGVVERIHVRPGQFVQAGTPLVSFTSSPDVGTAEILISLKIASVISVDSISYMQIGEREIEMQPIHISEEATEDQHYSVLYSIPKEYMDMIADKSFVRIDVPLENGIDSAAPMIPIDAVQLTQENSYVFLLIDGKAENREVSLGNVYGQFVQVINGINPNDEIILNRNVFSGDQVSKVEK